jgi:RluA family pseudouridine synthase
MSQKGTSQLHTHIVKEKISEVPLDEYAAQAFPLLGSKSSARKAIDDGRLKKNGKETRPGELVSTGDQLELTSLGLPKPKTFDFDLRSVYEDDFLIIVNKPGGIAVNGNRNKTVENALAGKLPRSPHEDGLPNPIATHRIDVPTKGLVMLARTKTALIELNRAFQEKRVKKAYVAVVHGKLEGKGRIDQKIKGKTAITDYESLKVAPSRVFGHLSLVKLYPVTGRTHQLRIHLQQRGHLVVGDREYAGREKTILGKGLFLCSCFLGFEHPITGEEVAVEIPVPKRFKRLLEREAKRY